MKFVLILIWMVDGNATAMTSAEFESEITCKVAADQIFSASGKRVMHFCFRSH